MTAAIPPDRYRVLDCLISRTNMRNAVRSIQDRVASGYGGYVCFSNVHTVVMSRHDQCLRQITNTSFMSMPDGKPLSIVGRWRGLRGLEHVAGPDFMPLLIDKAAGLKHFFYGSTPQTLARLTQALKQRFPDVQIVGDYAPPFRPLTPTEQEEVVAIMKKAAPDIIWIGLGAPRQEYWMAETWPQLKPAILMGVGAAFDFHAGQVTRAPDWLRKASLEWAFRLYQEPRRLWKRYLVTNSLFLYYLVKESLRRKS
jgi:N-acetylglucosaminyldiphosphoundecaprenol N-acetyl-beta-D-mannosaminyltransferase